MQWNIHLDRLLYTSGQFLFREPMHFLDDEDGLGSRNAGFFAV
jgi:hypothetical protein